MELSQTILFKASYHIPFHVSISLFTKVKEVIEGGFRLWQWKLLRLLLEHNVGRSKDGEEAEEKRRKAGRKIERLKLTPFIIDYSDLHYSLEGFLKASGRDSLL